MGTSSSRPYRKRKRAESERETRLRITEAAVELHRTKGPAHTSITEVAERAGVSRATLYNHFPTELDLFQACSGHWAEHNPLPDVERWAAVDDPRSRLAMALSDLYAWYEAKQDMLGNVLRDAPVVPAVGVVMDDLWRPFVDEVLGVLSEGWSVERPRDPVRDALLHLAVDYHTWALLTRSGLTSADAAAVVGQMVTCATERPT